LCTRHHATSRTERDTRARDRTQDQGSAEVATAASD
jgi:hypothetical protein